MAVSQHIAVALIEFPTLGVAKAYLSAYGPQPGHSPGLACGPPKAM
jgi:deoxyinosine 3'endonuclease (endonuclease V)